MTMFYVFERNNTFAKMKKKKPKQAKNQSKVKMGLASIQNIQISDQFLANRLCQKQILKTTLHFFCCFFQINADIDPKKNPTQPKITYDKSANLQCSLLAAYQKPYYNITTNLCVD